MKPAVKQSLLGGAMLLAVWLARLCERQMVNTQFMLRLSKINGGGRTAAAGFPLLSQRDDCWAFCLAWAGEKNCPS